MRGLLKKLQCDSYETLVAASSIIRPGVAKSGMMKEYIKRFHNQNDIKYIHPLIGSLLKETFGVMVYQEDVLKVCHHFAGLDLNDADLLRRMMNNKRHKEEEYDRLRQKFFNNCKSKGYNDDIIKEVWRQIESFAGYSFPKPIRHLTPWKACRVFISRLISHWSFKLLSSTISEDFIPLGYISMN